MDTLLELNFTTPVGLNPICTVAVVAMIWDNMPEWGWALIALLTPVVIGFILLLIAYSYLS